MIAPRWRKVLADLWLNKVRTILAVLSIAVGVFAVGMIAGTQVVLSRDLRTNYNAINRTYTPNRIWTNFTSLQLLYVRNFSDRWGMNANYWYQLNNRIYRAFGPTNENATFSDSMSTVVQAVPAWDAGFWGKVTWA